MGAAESLSLHFTRAEMQCPCCNACAMDPGFMEKLEQLRVAFNTPLLVNSGFRCEMHNAKIRGAYSSLHLKGQAADIAWTKVNSRSKHDFLRLALDLGFRGIGLAKNFIHLDIRTTDAAVWFY